MNYTKEDLEKAFEAGGTWLMACVNLTEGKISKFDWSETNDFEEFLEELNQEKQTTQSND